MYQLDTPYSAISWPNINLEDQDTILELLCNLLAPLGQYRSEHLTLSNGKRERKRKRKAPIAQPQHLPPPPVPELKLYVDVGLSAVTRYLQETASKEHSGKSNAEDKGVCQEPPITYSAIFVTRSGQPNVLNGHLPQMVAVASKAHPMVAPTRLVGLSKACEDRLSECLGIPRVSCIGLREGAPSSKALVDFTRQHVPVIEVMWLDEARTTEHKETNINVIETFVGSKKQHNRGPPQS